VVCDEAVVDPSELGLARATAGQLRGGDAAANARAARSVLDGAPGPHRDIVLLNAAAGLVVAGLVDDLASGLELAAETVDRGAARAALAGLVEASKAEAARSSRGS
jgi:anthranilate phosphoribosyltransferase